MKSADVLREDGDGLVRVVEPDAVAVGAHACYEAFHAVASRALEAVEGDPITYSEGDGNSGGSGANAGRSSNSTLKGVGGGGSSARREQLRTAIVEGLLLRSDGGQMPCLGELEKLAEPRLGSVNARHDVGDQVVDAGGNVQEHALGDVGKRVDAALDVLTEEAVDTESSGEGGSALAGGIGKPTSCSSEESST